MVGACQHVQEPICMWSYFRPFSLDNLLNRHQLMLTLSLNAVSKLHFLQANCKGQNSGIMYFQELAHIYIYQSAFLKWF